MGSKSCPQCGTRLGASKRSCHRCGFDEMGKDSVANKARRESERETTIRIGVGVLVFVVFVVVVVIKGSSFEYSNQTPNQQKLAENQEAGGGFKEDPELLDEWIKKGEYQPSTSSQRDLSKHSIIYSVPIPSDAVTVSSSPAEGEYTTRFDAYYLRSFFKAEMTIQGWEKYEPSTASFLNYRKGNRIVLITINSGGGRFSVTGGTR